MSGDSPDNAHRFGQGVIRPIGREGSGIPRGRTKCALKHHHSRSGIREEICRGRRRHWQRTKGPSGGRQAVLARLFSWMKSCDKTGACQRLFCQRLFGFDFWIAAAAPAAALQCGGGRFPEFMMVAALVLLPSTSTSIGEGQSAKHRNDRLSGKRELVCIGDLCATGRSPSPLRSSGGFQSGR